VAVCGRAGDPGVLCLHGFPEGWMSWRSVMKHLPGRRVCAPDLRGYGDTERPPSGYDVETLTDDVAALIDALGLERPALVGHDWGGALAWIFAHRHPELISRLVVVNCTHPRTLVRAVLHVEDLQTFRIPWVPFFEIPWLPETAIATALGRRLLKLSFTLREGRPGTMDVGLVDELVARFRTPADVHGPIAYYREMVLTQALPWRRGRLDAVYDAPIRVPVTVVWGEKDGALSESVARKSERDAGCPVEWRPLPDVGHFVSLEAPERLAAEIARVVPTRSRERLRVTA
jgi:pimeloyl-ACP methyl ester carboxylesterase